MTTVLPKEDLEETTNQEEDNYAHIIWTPNGNAESIILDARVNGKELVALCGKKFIPKRDPEKLPVCPRCQALRES